MKYQVNDRVKINNPKSTWHGKEAVILEVNPNAKFPKAYPYRVKVGSFDYWFPESELTGVN